MHEQEALAEFMEECYRLYEQKMYQSAYGILHDCTWAEDAVQDAFLKLLKGRVYFEDPQSEHCKRYIITVIRHSAVDLYNRKKKEQQILRALEADVCEERAAGFRDREQTDELTEMILDLRPRYYAVVDCLAIKGMTVMETSQKLGISEEAVRKRFERSKKMLKIAWAKKRYL